MQTVFIHINLTEQLPVLPRGGSELGDPPPFSTALSELESK